MAQALATTRRDPAPSTPSSKLSEQGLAKAIRLFSELQPVAENSRLIDPADAARIIAAIDETLKPCSQNEAATLVAELIGCYPELSMAKADAAQSKDFRLYTVKVLEAFSQFSFAIGKAICHGGTGLPAQSPYRPKPADVVTFGKAEEAKRLNAKTMAQRHMAEHARRAAEREEEARFNASRSSPEERARKVQALLGTLRNDITPAG